MKLKELISGLQVVAFQGNMDIEIEAIAYDSRMVKEKSLFVCIEGFQSDGHDYIKSAIANGAAAILMQKDVAISDPITTIQINNTRYGLAAISDKFFGHPSNKFELIGVTGTKGKTTTTFMIKSILEADGKKAGLIGTVANYIGNEMLSSKRTTPESYDLQSLFSEMNEKGVEGVAMEVSSHALDLDRVSCCDFDIGIFTNLTQDHLDYHKTFDNYFEAKLKLFELCKKSLVNVDDGYGLKAMQRINCEKLSYGIDREADIRAINMMLYSDSVSFDAVTPWGNKHFEVSIPGKFTVYNALAAIGCAGLLGIELDKIQDALKKASVPGRAEVTYSDKDFTVVIDYAHSPDSLENILTTLKHQAPGRLVSVFGCGGDRDKTKRPIMGEISGRIADFTVITSDNPRTEEPAAIIKDIEAGIKGMDSRCVSIVGRREAIKYAIENRQPKDIILLAGKGHETYQIFKDETIHFDEREVVAEILTELKITGEK